MSITLTKITTPQLESAIEWLACAFPYWSTDGRTAQQIYRAVRDNYDGGWEGFLSDLGDDSWA